MRAGQTEFECGTKVRIIGCEDTDFIGIEGILQQPYVGSMVGITSVYLAGLDITKGNDVFSNGSINLIKGDIIEVIE